MSNTCVKPFRPVLLRSGTHGPHTQEVALRRREARGEPPGTTAVSGAGLARLETAAEPLLAKPYALELLRPSLALIK